MKKKSSKVLNVVEKGTLNTNAVSHNIGRVIHTLEVIGESCSLISSPKFLEVADESFSYAKIPKELST